MAAQSDMPLLEPKEEQIMNVVDSLSMEEFDDTPSGMIGDQASEEMVLAPEDNVPEQQQYLTLPSGGKITVNEDGIIVFTQEPQATETTIEETNIVETPANDNATFYLRTPQGIVPKQPAKDMTTNTTYYFNKSDGILTEEKRSYVTIQPDGKAGKRPALVPSGVRNIGTKVYVQNTGKGPVVKRSPVVSKPQTISFAQAQQMGLVLGDGRKAVMRKISGSGGSIVLKQNKLSWPAGTIKTQPIRTIPSLSQVKTTVTMSNSQQLRPITLTKTASAITLGGKTPPKVYYRPSSRPMSLQIGGKQQIVKLVSPGTAAGPKVVSITKPGQFIQRTPVGKTVFITSDGKQVHLAPVNKTVGPVTISLRNTNVVSERNQAAEASEQPRVETIKIEKEEKLVAEEEVDDINEKDDELPEELEDERPDSPQKLLEANGIRPKKPCNCSKTQCLKLYCECFANGEFCFECNCDNCFNNIEHEEERQFSIKTCLERNPDAFRRKVQVATISDSEDEERRQGRGCNCKRTNCLKNYCECFEGKVMCGKSCKCTSCKNTEHVMGAWMRGESVESGDEPEAKDSSKAPFMPKALAEALCQCILVQAETASRAGEDIPTSELRIIEELGQRLVQIIGNRSKKDVL